MTRVYNNIYSACTGTRLYNLCSLFFFALVFFSSCQSGEPKEIAIIWKNGHPVAVSVPISILDVQTGDSVSSLLKVRVASSSGPILGDYRIGRETVIFQPLLPLSQGLDYEILFRNQKLGHIKVPAGNSVYAPSLVMMYPSSDTLPENLLKIYLRFSHPMREGVSGQFLNLLDTHKDTVRDVFLDLQPELWNQDRTVLTVWLDPGRIKRQLIPNQRLGNPLKNGRKYTLTVSPGWIDTRGVALKQPFNKQFVVTTRDSSCPDLQNWQLILPPVETTRPIQIVFGEPLDFYLLQETLRILDENGVPVDGSLKPCHEETSVLFTPNKKWLPRHYRLQVESILEDLAGNNLDRPFDRDIYASTKKARPFFERDFEIKK